VEGRVIRRRRALPPPPEVRTDLAVLADLADRLGFGRHFSADPRTVFEELRRASAGGIADYAGISYERIDAEDGVFWPCPAQDHPGTPRLFVGAFPTADGRARFVRVEHRDPAELPDADFPYVLTTGRTMQQYQSGTQTRRVRSLLVALPEPRAELHPDLARRHGIADGDLVELRSRRGRTVVRARLTPGVRPDTVFAPFHWPGVNALTNPALDPHSRMPAFKACAVAIAPCPSKEEPSK
jgi:assimilatory nitrate reductase catalytic subunit